MEHGCPLRSTVFPSLLVGLTGIVFIVLPLAPPGSPMSHTAQSTFIELVFQCICEFGSFGIAHRGKMGDQCLSCIFKPFF